ncbi:MAG TPA: DNA polymerase III subunit beta [Dehalococcoidia bacterium]|nr:DNA polymerase III subunit beta [Dehalococcoidia bacterium]
MKLSCLQENLSKGLSIVGRAVATRATLPITQNVLLATDQSQLKLVATNLEIATTCWIGAKVEEEGAITVPARLLTEFVNSLPSERVDLSLTPKTRSLSVRCARFEGHISGQDAGDFPPIPEVTEGVEAAIDAEALHEAITHVVFAAATEDTRPVLTGVYAEFKGKALTLAAADGFRLAVYKTSLSKKVAEKPQAVVSAQDRYEAIIPARALHELSRLLTEQEEPIGITLNPTKGQVLFKLKNAELVSQLIQGTFPNYAQLIPQSYVTRTLVDTAEFLRATRMASIFARDGSGIVRLQITPGGEAAPGKMVVSARAEEIGDNVGELDAIVEGEAAKIAFNGKYLADVLGVLHGGQIALETTSPSSPGVIKPVGREDYVHVVMPMFVQW